MIYNQSLIAAIEALKNYFSDANRQRLYDELRAATFLVPFKESDKDDDIRLSVIEDDGRLFVSVYTDFDYFSQCHEDNNVAMSALSLKELSDLLALSDDYTAFIINPLRESLVISKKLANTLLEGCNPEDFEPEILEIAPDTEIDIFKPDNIPDDTIDVFAEYFVTRPEIEEAYMTFVKMNDEVGIMFILDMPEKENADIIADELVKLSKLPLDSMTVVVRKSEIEEAALEESVRIYTKT